MKLKIVTIIAGALFISMESNAQLIWDQNVDTDKSNLSLEWIKPKFDEEFNNDEKITFFSSALFLQGQMFIGKGFSLIGDIPISHWEFKDGDGVDTQAPHTTIGNIYIGGSYRFKKVFDDRLSPSLELGTRLPTMPEPDYPDKRGVVSGYYSSIDRREAFTIDILPIIGVLNAEFAFNSVATLRLRGGGSYWIDQDSFYQQNQLYLIQGVQFYFSTPELGGNFGLTGKYNVAPTDALLSNDDITQVRAGINRNISNWNIETFIRAPLDNSFLRWAFGVKANFILNKPNQSK